MEAVVKGTVRVCVASLLFASCALSNDAEPRPRKPIRIDLGAAGMMRGTPVGEFVELRTRYGSTRVMASQIGQLLMDPDQGSLTVVLVNGDRLERVRLTRPLAVETSFGDLSLDMDGLRESVTSSPPVSVAVDLKDGTILTGAPLEFAVRDASGQTAVPIVDLMQIETSGEAGDATARRWAAAEPQVVKLTGNVRLNSAFGEVAFPASEIRRVRVLLNKDDIGMRAELGNLALARRGTTARCPYGPQYLNDGDTLEKTGGRTYGYGKFPASFLLKLRRQTMVSHIRFLLWDRDHRSFQYVLETSVDGVNWDEIADRSEGWWRSWQSHTFPVRPVRYVRVRGLNCTLTTYFHIAEIEVYTHAPSKPVRSRWASGVPDDEARRQSLSRRWRR